MNTAKYIDGKDIIDSLRHIASSFQLADIYVFGSRAREIAAMVRGESQKGECALSGSDVDIAVRQHFGKYLSAKERVELMAIFEDLLNVSRVDLVILPEADSFLALEVIRGELLFTTDPDDQARYELFVMRRAGDLMPYKKERIRMILEEGGR